MGRGVISFRINRLLLAQVLLSVSLPVCLSKCLSLYPSVYLPVSVCASPCLSIYMETLCFCASLHVCRSHFVVLPICLSVSLPVFLSFSFYMVIFNSLSVCVCACAQKVLSELREDPQAFGVKSEILRTLPRGRTLVEYR